MSTNRETLPKASRWSDLRRGLRSFGTGFRWFFKTLYNSWDHHSIYFSAAAVAFNILVTAIPLAVLIFAVSSSVAMGDSTLREGFLNWLSELKPFVAESVILDFQGAVQHQSTAVGFIGFFTLLWMVSRLFGTIRTALDRIFSAPGRHMVLGKLYDFVLALLVAICFVLAVLSTVGARVAVESGAGRVIAGTPLVGPALTGFLGRVLSFSFAFLVFFLLYWAGPNRRIPLKLAIPTAFACTLFTTAGTSLYMWSISRPSWGFVYGSFIGVMATLLWLYWLCVIFLAAAEVASIINRTNEARPRT
ncbi:MAG: YihY/virulence factor BrkB family protein [Candidatus Fermentibacteraceae bacterium]